MQNQKMVIVPQGENYSTLQYWTNRSCISLKDSETSQKTRSWKQHIIHYISVALYCIDRWEEQILNSSYGIQFWNHLIASTHRLWVTCASFTACSSFTFLTDPIFIGMMHKVKFLLQLEQCNRELSTADVLLDSVHHNEAVSEWITAV